MTAIPDGHVHTEWSWDADQGSMLSSCRRAVELGLPSIAFTEHADFVQVHRGQRPLDLEGYLGCIERCRSAFPELEIVAGVELGEPHRHPRQAAALLRAGRIDRVLGSVHCIPSAEGPVDMSQDSLYAADPARAVKTYFEEVLGLVSSSEAFEVLAHLDYPKRYWPHDRLPYRESDFEEELRAVLRAAAEREAVLEVNTTRGREHSRGLCPGPVVLDWWRQVGGRAVAFGSDAHSPDMVAAGFAEAAPLVEAAGFRPCDDPAGYWRR